VDDLRGLANQRARDAAPARGGQRDAQADERANEILSTHAPVPGDVSARVQAQVGGGLKRSVQKWLRAVQFIL